MRGWAGKVASGSQPPADDPWGECHCRHLLANEGWTRSVTVSWAITPVTWCSLRSTHVSLRRFWGLQAGAPLLMWVDGSLGT